jgi:uncharacterized protein (TIGR02145 family)
MKAPAFSSKNFLALILLLLTVLVFTHCGEDGQVAPCTVGAACDDGNASTENDKYNANCDCVGTPVDCAGIGDADDDGVCADIDCDDNDAGNTETDADGDGICTPLDCDDDDAGNTSVDMDEDGVCGDIDCDDNDAGNTETDADEDGICTPEDCDDEDPDIYPGAACDDGNAGTFNDVYNENCVCEGTLQETFSDPRDGTVYPLVDIGPQKWMAKNMNYDVPDSRCYNDDPANCVVYGRLYNFSMAQSVCPDGFHLPSKAEWESLISQLGGILNAGGKLKETGFEHWNSPNAAATNESGFTALGAGWKTSSGNYELLKSQTNFWSTTQPSAGNGNTMVLSASTGYASMVSSSATIVLSVRCLKD